MTISGIRYAVYGDNQGEIRVVDIQRLNDLVQRNQRDLRGEHHAAHAQDEDELVALEAEAGQRIGGQRGNQNRADNRGARHQHGVEEVLGNTALPCERIVIPERTFGHRPNVFVNFLVAFQGIADHPE